MTNSIVSICTDATADAKSLLEQTLDRSGLWKSIEVKRKQAGSSKEAFIVLIKPDLEFYEQNGLTGTSPYLVEHLVSLLAAKGYPNIIVADAENGSGLWLDNRDVPVLADLAGYRYETDDGVTYNIENLSENLAPGDFDKHSVLKDEQLSQYWIDAGFHIIFCKNKTDEEFYYSLVLKNLVDILPARAKHYHYYFRLKTEEVVAAVLQRNDIDFCIVDAWESNHGMQGARHTKGIFTNTFIAGNNPLLTDWVASLKMGLDPYCSPINGYALKTIGLPARYQLDGNLSVYEGWQNVPRILAESVRSRNQNPVLRLLSKAWLQDVDTELFPFRNVTDAQVNKFVSSVVKDIDQHPLAYSALVSLNYLLGGIQKFVAGWQVMFEKEKLYREQRELGFDPGVYKSRDYEDIENYILQLAPIAAHAAPDANGIKWRYIDGSVLFEYSRILPYDFLSFVKKADITQAVQYMFDNSGGARVGVKSDSKGRVIYQAERDIYLPQPNWMVMFGGEPIDVCKIELVRYREDSQTIYWKTVKSINQSAEFDDGLVSFSAVSGGYTEIRIVSRQKFGLPLFWQVFNMDYVPAMKDALVSDSYIRFFNRTMANFEAVYEGRNPKLGKIADPEYGETTQYDHPFEAEQFKNVLAVVSGIAEKFLGRYKGAGKTKNLYEDEDGYMHSTADAYAEAGDPLDAVRSFIKDVSQAIQKDIKYLGNMNQ